MVPRNAGTEVVHEPDPVVGVRAQFGSVIVVAQPGNCMDRASLYSVQYSEVGDKAVGRANLEVSLRFERDRIVGDRYRDRRRRPGQRADLPVLWVLRRAAARRRRRGPGPRRQRAELRSRHRQAGDKRDRATQAHGDRNAPCAASGNDMATVRDITVTAAAPPPSRSRSSASLLARLTSVCRAPSPDRAPTIAERYRIVREISVDYRGRFIRFSWFSGSGTLSSPSWCPNRPPRPNPRREPGRPHVRGYRSSPQPPPDARSRFRACLSIFPMGRRGSSARTSKRLGAL